MGIPKNFKTSERIENRIIALSHLSQHHSQLPKGKDNLNVHLLINEQRK
jgi:hypothetical protein